MAQLNSAYGQLSEKFAHLGHLEAAKSTLFWDGRTKMPAGGSASRGKVMAARQQGASIPADWAFDREGRPTTNAEEALAGTMIPAGDSKGAALALMVEILAAGLTGANYSFESSSLFDDKGAPPALGHTIIAINPAAASAADTAQRLALLAGEITRDPNVRLPGRRGQSSRRLALSEGITVEDEVIAAIERL